jgi:hypothetical protein
MPAPPFQPLLFLHASVWMTIHDHARLTQAEKLQLPLQPLTVSQSSLPGTRPGPPSPAAATSSLLQQGVLRSKCIPTRFPHCRFRLRPYLIIDVCFKHACERGVEAALLQLLVNFRRSGHFPTSWLIFPEAGSSFDLSPAFDGASGTPCCSVLGAQNFPKKRGVPAFPDPTYEEPGCTTRHDGAAAGEGAENLSRCSVCHSFSSSPSRFPPLRFSASLCAVSLF